MKTVAAHRELYGDPPSSAAAEEGTRAHEKMEKHLRLSSSAQLLGPINDKGPRAVLPREVVRSEGRELSEDDDEYDDLLPMLEWVDKQEGALFLETRFDFGQHFGYVGLEGTGDITLVEPDCITIADLKYGRGIVEVEDAKGVPNRQLMVYLAGAVATFGPRPKYRITILQPRAWHRDGPIRSRDVSAAEFSVFLFDLENAIEANFGNGACTPGDHCQDYCPARSTCRALKRKCVERFRDED